MIMAVQHPAVGLPDVPVHEFSQEEKYLRIEFGDRMDNRGHVAKPYLFGNGADGFIDVCESSEYAFRNSIVVFQSLVSQVDIGSAWPVKKIPKHM